MPNTTSFQSVIQDLPDPRQAGQVVFPLDEILLLSLCGTISGCDSFVEIAEYGEEKLAFLRELAPFDAGIPSHDTLCAVFRQLDPVAFSKAFSDWARDLGARISGCIVEIDGKTVRGSKAAGGNPLHVISAFCDDLRPPLIECLAFDCRAAGAGATPLRSQEKRDQGYPEASRHSVSEGGHRDAGCDGVPEGHCAKNQGSQG